MKDPFVSMTVYALFGAVLGIAAGFVLSLIIFGVISLFQLNTPGAMMPIQMSLFMGMGGGAVIGGVLGGVVGLKKAK